MEAAPAPTRVQVVPDDTPVAVRVDPSSLKTVTMGNLRRFINDNYIDVVVDMVKGDSVPMGARITLYDMAAGIFDAVTEYFDGKNGPGWKNSWSGAHIRKEFANTVWALLGDLYSAYIDLFRWKTQTYWTISMPVYSLANATLARVRSVSRVITEGFWAGMRSASSRMLVVYMTIRQRFHDAAASYETTIAAWYRKNTYDVLVRGGYADDALHGEELACALVNNRTACKEMNDELRVILNEGRRWMGIYSRYKRITRADPYIEHYYRTKDDDVVVNPGG